VLRDITMEGVSDAQLGRRVFKTCDIAIHMRSLYR
jgi:hypothetical protein